MLNGVSSLVMYFVCYLYCEGGRKQRKSRDISLPSTNFTTKLWESVLTFLRGTESRFIFHAPSDVPNLDSGRKHVQTRQRQSSYRFDRGGKFDARVVKARANIYSWVNYGYFALLDGGNDAATSREIPGNVGSAGDQKYPSSFWGKWFLLNALSSWLFFERWTLGGDAALFLDKVRFGV